MEELGLVGDLAFVAVAAFIGGVVARSLRLPTLLGYLAAGLVIGPHISGLAGDTEQVQRVADLGVALLMFTLGIRFSLRELQNVRWLALVGGLGQISIMIGLGTLLGKAVGLSTGQALLVGSVVSISSTMVALRLLEGKGEIGGPAGSVGIAFALIQDLAVVLLIVMIPVLGADNHDDVLANLGLASAKALGLLVAVWVVGIFLVPRVLGRVTLTRSRELFLLSVVALALGTASVSFLAGLSLAFGAFLAGLVVSESEYAHQTLAEVFPLREVFAVVFFVAAGMLINPASFLDEPQLVWGIAAIGIFGKLLLVTAFAIAFGYSRKAALTAGLALANMGEFSFVLAAEGVKEGIFDADQNGAVLAAVLISIASSPLLLLAREPILKGIRSLPVLGPMMKDPMEVHYSERESLRNHVIVCGFDQAGRELGDVLKQRGFRFVVIDQDPVLIRRLTKQGVPCILGDAALPTVLDQAALAQARVLAVTMPDVSVVQSVLVVAKQLNPRLDVIVRGDSSESLTRLHDAGASEVVKSELEVGLEFVRHTLHRMGVSGQELQALIARRRKDIYGDR